MQTHTHTHARKQAPTQAHSTHTANTHLQSHALKYTLYNPPTQHALTPHTHKRPRPPLSLTLVQLVPLPDEHLSRPEVVEEAAAWRHLVVAVRRAENEAKLKCVTVLPRAV